MSPSPYGHLDQRCQDRLATDGLESMPQSTSVGEFAAVTWKDTRHKP
jgi:hypothetical protein